MTYKLINNGHTGENQDNSEFGGNKWLNSHLAKEMYCGASCVVAKIALSSF